MDRAAHILFLLSIYGSLAAALEVLVGVVGLMSAAHAAIFGTGAYVSAILAVRLGLPFPISAVAACIAAMLLSTVLWALLVRLRGDLFVIGTVAVQLIITNVFLGWTNVTGGPLGIARIPQPFGSSADDAYAVLSVSALLLAVFTWGATAILRTGQSGRILRAIREDEVLVSSLGWNVQRHKLIVVVVSSGIAGTAGSVFAHYITVIDPSLFGIQESILLLAMVLIGGADSRWGPWLGAALLILLPELFRDIGIPNSIAGSLRQLLYGGALVAIIVLRPMGLLGRFNFSENVR